MTWLSKSPQLPKGEFSFTDGCRARGMVLSITVPQGLEMRRKSIQEVWRDEIHGWRQPGDRAQDFKEAKRQLWGSGRE